MHQYNLDLIDSSDVSIAVYIADKQINNSTLAISVRIIITLSTSRKHLSLKKTAHWLSVGLISLRCTRQRYNNLRLFAISGIRSNSKSVVWEHFNITAKPIPDIAVCSFCQKEITSQQTKVSKFRINEKFGQWILHHILLNRVKKKVKTVYFNYLSSNFVSIWIHFRGSSC